MPAKTEPPAAADQLAAAQAAETAAQERLAEVQELVRSGETVTEEAYAAAVAATAIAEHRREGAQRDLTAAARKERLSEYSRIAADIEAAADPAGAADEEDQAAEAIARRLTRNLKIKQGVAEWTRQLQAVEDAKDAKDAEDAITAGVSWRGDGHFGGTPPYVQTDACVVHGEGDAVIMARITAAAAAKAGLLPGALELPR